MKRRWTGFLAAVVILVSSCLPALSTIAAEKEETASRAAAYTAGMERKQADYTVIYTARDGENETVLAKEIFRAPVGETVNIQHKDFKNYAREAGQGSKDDVIERYSAFAGFLLLLSDFLRCRLEYEEKREYECKMDASLDYIRERTRSCRIQLEGNKPE